jgi:hypothetical protein
VDRKARLFYPTTQSLFLGKLYFPKNKGNLSLKLIVLTNASKLNNLLSNILVISVLVNSNKFYVF